MKNLIFKYSTMIMALLAVIILPTSCIEEPDSAVEGVGQNRFRVPAGNFSLIAFNAAQETRPIIEIFRDANSNSALNQSASFTMTLSASALEAYNEEHDTDFELLPTANYSLQGIEGTTVSFAPGEFSKTISLSLNPAGLDFSKQYALAYTLSNPSNDYGISATQGDVIVTQITVKNAYHGTYASVGYFLHPVATSSRDIAREKELVTSGPNSVKTELADLGGSGYEMKLIVNADNTVTIEGNISGAPLAIKQDYQVNKYDPATGEFDLKYSYNTAAPRIINEILSPK